MSKIAMGPGLSSRPSTSCFPGCAISSPTAFIMALTCARPSSSSATGPSKSSNAPLTPAGFQLLPRRWVVERTFAWLNRNRRLAKDFEASIASAKNLGYIASVQLLIRRLACP